MGRTRDAPTVGLVLCTVDRLLEPDRMLNTLARQTRRPDRVVVVDQNDDDRLVPVLAKYADCFPVTHVRTGRGLSRARNVGLVHVTEDVVGFPDDDCTYDPHVVERVAASFTDPSLDLLAGAMATFEGRRYFPKTSMFRRRPRRWHTPYVFCSANTFVRTQAVRDAGGFDESLGLGSGTDTPGEEDSDLCYRVLGRGARARARRDVRVFHERKRTDPARAAVGARCMHYLAARHGGDLRTDAWLVAPRVGHAFALLATGRAAGARARAREVRAICRGVREARRKHTRPDRP